MATIIEMPKLSDTMTVGTLISWLKKEGDKVRGGDMLAEVETDKATMELENFEDGVLLATYVKEGEQVPIGTPICAVGAAGEALPPAPSRKGAAPAKAEAPKPAAPAPAVPAPAPVKAEAAKPAAPAPTPAAPAPTPKADAPAPAGDGERLKASPLAKKVAKELGVELTGLAGSGPGGRIVRADVVAASERPKPAPVPETPAPAAPALAKAAAPAPFVAAPGMAVQADAAVPVTTMRAVIAKRLLESKVTVPHFYLEIEVDAAPLSDLRAKLNGAFADLKPEQGGIKFTFNDLIMKAATEALRRVPDLNVSWMGDTIQRHGAVHMSFGVALEDGLVTPVIRDAHAKGLRQISLEAKELIAKAKSKKLKPNEMSGSTFTISNPGMLGIDFFYAIINPPNAAILSVGAIQKKPVVNERDEVVVGTRMRLGLSVDHRAVDGATGIVYLRALKDILENPASMLV